MKTICMTLPEREGHWHDNRALVNGDIVEVADGVADSLIGQGLAVECQPQAIAVSEPVTVQEPAKTKGKPGRPSKNKAKTDEAKTDEADEAEEAKTDEAYEAEEAKTDEADEAITGDPQSAVNAILGNDQDEE